MLYLLYLNGIESKNNLIKVHIENTFFSDNLQISVKVFIYYYHYLTMYLLTNKLVRYLFWLFFLGRSCALDAYGDLELSRESPSYWLHFKCVREG